MENDDKEKFVKEDAHKWRILWISVGFVTVFLIGIWAWSFKYRLVNTNWDQSSEKQMMENLRRDWQEASDIINKPLAEKKAAEEAVKDKLMQMVGTGANASSSAEETPSSTENIISTTTNQLE